MDRTRRCDLRASTARWHNKRQHDRRSAVIRYCWLTPNDHVAARVRRIPITASFPRAYRSLFNRQTRNGRRAAAASSCVELLRRHAVRCTQTRIQNRATRAKPRTWCRVRRIRRKARRTRAIPFPLRSVPPLEWLRKRRGGSSTRLRSGSRVRSGAVVVRAGAWKTWLRVVTCCFTGKK